MNCPSCGQPLEPGYARCFRCGHELVQGDASLPHMFPDGEPPEEPVAEGEMNGGMGAEPDEVRKPWWQFWRAR